MQSNPIITNVLRGIKSRANKMTDRGSKRASLTWLKEKYLKHASQGPTRTFLLHNKPLLYSQPSELLHTLKEIFVEEIYNIELPANPFIVDCGANIGLGVIYLKQRYPSAEVIAFEPDEKNYHLLTSNISSFQFTNVELRNEAVWIEDTTLQFSSDGTMGSKIEKTSGSNTRAVKAVKLANFLKRKVDFLKMDIEGAEYEVVKDLKDSLENVQNMFLEYHGDFSQNTQLTEIFSILTNAGFNYYIKEAAEIYKSPFLAANKKKITDFDVQLNIFCFRKNALTA